MSAAAAVLFTFFTQSKQVRKKEVVYKVLIQDLFVRSVLSIWLIT